MASIMILISVTGIGWWTYILFALNGLVQSVGYPACFAIVSQWFSKATRGTVLGFWASCGSCGNVIGAFITSTLLGKGYSWGYTFAIVGSISYGYTLINCFFVKEPAQVGIEINDNEGFEKVVENQDQIETAIGSEPQIEQTQNEEKGVTLKEAMLFPGVLKNSFNYFCLKFSYYSLVFWLPLYVMETQDATDAEVSGCVALFEIGVLSGALLIGVVSDFVKGRRYLCLWFTIIFGSVATLCLANHYSKFIIFTVGAFIGGSSLVV
jgi:sugar phosphate permease